ncbi:MAG: hypothetical protein IKH32_08800 [Prevotella sp.]|nr:hypothetical protein [Prevotella sp.]
MKKKLLKTLLVAVCLGGANFAWADDVVPTPVYFNDFSFAVNGQDGIEIVGNGVFEDDADAHFGKIFHNDPTLTKAIRTNYLKLPADVLSHSGTTKEMTIGFWVNMKDAADFYWSPLFTAYPNATKASDAVSPWPIFTCLARKVVSLNCWGYCNLGDTYNDKRANAETSAWLDDKAWHYYTITLTSTTVKVYIDGVVENSWTVDGTSDGQVITGLFNAGADYTHENGLKYICLGGNQSNNYNDPDPAFGFDDFAVYDVALSKTQIDQIRANKLDRSLTGTKVGNQNNSTEYLTATSDKVTLKPGESYHYSFINYNNGYTNHNNWMLPVYDSSDANVIAVRADNWEDKHHVGETWGSNAGCTSNFNWTNFPGNMNGATVEMTVTFTAEKVFNMSSTINTVDGSEWSYSYTNDYTGSPIDLTSDDYIKVALSVSRSWLDITSEGYSAVSATIGATGWTTFASPYALDLSSMTASEGDVTAYYASAVGDGKVTMTSTESTGVAAGEGLMLKGTAGATITIPVVASGTSIDGNKLVGCTSSTTLTANANYYVLVNNGGIAEFQSLADNGATIPTGKAYLNASGATARLSIVFDDKGVEAIKDIDKSDKSGSQADGKYIEKGKIVIEKNGMKFNTNGQKIK